MPVHSMGFESLGGLLFVTDLGIAEIVLWIVMTAYENLEDLGLDQVQ